MFLTIDDVIVFVLLAGEGGQPCTMLVRTKHWVVPSYSIWGLPFFIFFSTRFSQLFYQRPNMGFFRFLLCLLMSPLVRDHQDTV